MDPQVETCMPEGNQSVHAHTYAILKTTDRAYYKRTGYLIHKPSTKRWVIVSLEDSATHIYFENKDNCFRNFYICSGDSIV